MNRFLAAVGDVNDPVTWSGIPYHLLQEGLSTGFINEGLPLSASGKAWSVRRLAWNLSRALGGDAAGGYQYSLSFLEALWKPHLDRIKNSTVINCFQLYPPSILEDASVEKWIFVDQTLIQLLDYYGQRASIGQSIADEALRRERETYHRVKGVVVHSRWAAESVTAYYNVPADKVHVVVPGASIPRKDYEIWEKARENQMANESEDDNSLRLVFVGKYWHRKGLDRLLQGLRIARREGSGATLRVIGCSRESLPRDLRDVDGVEWAGFIDKRSQAVRFLQMVSDCNVGCLLSRAEAGGIALREYHALGLVVLGTDTGGSPEHMLEGASIKVAIDAGPEEIAGKLLLLEREEEKFQVMRKRSWQLRQQALWSHSVERLASIVGGETDGSR